MNRKICTPLDKYNKILMDNIRIRLYYFLRYYREISNAWTNVLCQMNRIICNNKRKQFTFPGIHNKHIFIAISHDVYMMCTQYTYYEIYEIFLQFVQLLNAILHL